MDMALMVVETEWTWGLDRNHDPINNAMTRAMDWETQVIGDVKERALPAMRLPWLCRSELARIFS